MKFSLIICTYMRPEALCRLLDSVNKQSLYPDEIIIIDGSTNDETEKAIEKCADKNLRYYLVPKVLRGLTRQRNYGIGKVSDMIENVCFLDDDIVLDQNYFKNLMLTYQEKPDAIAIGGYIINEVQWIHNQEYDKQNPNSFCLDGYCRAESLRFNLRAKLGLAPNRPPGHLPKFSHGRSIGFLPPTGQTYPVEQFMGGVSSYKKEVFDKIKFSTYFEGYGLYEDADFCFRLCNYGKLYVNTAAQCEHHHHPSGRPNQFQYGQMVVRNGWYVWCLRWPKPGFKNVVKWHCTTLLLAFLRFLNTFTTSQKQQVLTESLGRFWAWIKLLLVKPKIKR